MSKRPHHARPLIRTPIELACLPADTITTAAEVALFLGCSVTRLRRWEREGHGPGCLPGAFHTSAGEYRIGDVRRWMALPLAKAGT